VKEPSFFLLFLRNTIRDSVVGIRKGWNDVYTGLLILVARLPSAVQGFGLCFGLNSSCLVCRFPRSLTYFLSRIFHEMYAGGETPAKYLAIDEERCSVRTPLTDAYIRVTSRGTKWGWLSNSLRPLISS
jgi:hypothetical protein